MSGAAQSRHVWEALGELTADEVTRLRHSPQGRKLIAEVARRGRFAAGIAAFERTLFQQQQKVLATSNRFVAIHAGRRAGKTTVGRMQCYRTALQNPGKTTIVIERTLTCEASNVFWRQLKAESLTYGLGLHFIETTRTATAPNAAVIAIKGVDKLDEVDKIRGDGLAGVLVDEAGSYRPAVLRSLLTDAIRPALADLQGWLWLVGTPNESCLGPFADACGSSVYETHAWDMRSNPALARVAESELASVRKEHGWDEAHPAYRREWLGEWAYDPNDAVYDWAEGRNAVAAIPSDIDSYAIGVDLGYLDAAAIVVVGWCRWRPEIYVVKCWKESGVLPSQVAERLRQTWEDLGASRRVQQIVVDTGGLGRAICEEFVQRYGIPAVAAEKTGKFAAISNLNDDLRRGLLLVGPGCEDLVIEWRGQRWGRARVGREVVPRLDDGAAEDHLSDATLYAWREATHWVKRENPRQETEEERMERDQEMRHKRSRR